MKYTKIDDDKFEVEEAAPKIIYDKNKIREQIEGLRRQRDHLNSEMDRLRALLDEAKKIGVE